MYKGEDLWKKPEIQVVKKTLSNGKVITTYPDLPKNIYSSFKNVFDDVKNGKYYPQSYSRKTYGKSGSCGR